MWINIGKMNVHLEYGGDEECLILCMGLTNRHQKSKFVMNLDNGRPVIARTKLTTEKSFCVMSEKN